MRTFFVILAGVVLLVVIAAYVLVRFNADKLAAVIGERVREATGQTFVLSNLGLSLYPRPGVSFGESRWGDPQQNRISASVHGGSLHLAPGPLLHGRIEVDALFLDQPKVLVRSDAPQEIVGVTQGRGSSGNPGGNPDGNTGAGGDSAASGFDFSRIILRRFEIRDGECELPAGRDILRFKSVNLLFENEEPARQTGEFKASGALSLSRGKDALDVPLSVQGVLRLRENTVSLEKLAAVLAETRMQGAAQLLPGRLVADLKLDALDLNPYLQWFSRSGEPESSAQPSLPFSSTPSGTDADKARSATGRFETDLALEIGRLTIRKLALNNLKARLHGAQGRYRVEPCAFDLFGGAVLLKAEADMAVQPPRWSLDGKADNLSLDAASLALAGKGYAGGALSLTASLSASGDGAEALLRSLDGTGALKGRDVAVETAYLPGEVSSRVGGRHIVFDTLDGVFAVRKGVIAVQRLELAGRSIGAQAVGDVDLPGSQLRLNGFLNVVGVSLPLRITGPLEKPSFKLDTGRLLMNTLQGVGKMLQERSSKSSSGSTGNPLKNLLRKF